jgi:hypothetical protein
MIFAGTTSRNVSDLSVVPAEIATITLAVGIIQIRCRYHRPGNKHLTAVPPI